MQTIDQLNERFAIPDIASFEHGIGDMARLSIMTQTAEAHVYVHGAHVSHYHPRGQEPVLYLSPKSGFGAGKAIRGGVPVIFPWFGPRDGDASNMHGFVRTRTWEVADVKREGDAVRAVFTLNSSDETKKIWNHDFALKFSVVVGKHLEMELEAHNTAAEAVEFEDALHTYYHVSDVRDVSLSGLANTEYLDKNLGHQRHRDVANPLTLTGPVDRVYLDTPAACVISDPNFKRKITIEKENSRSTVVWNPWQDKAKTFIDLKAEEWDNFLCVETCNVKTNAVKLEPGAKHALRARIKAEPA